MDQKQEEELTEKILMSKWIAKQFEAPGVETMPHYPVIKDAGEELNYTRNDNRPAVKQFEEWLNNSTAFNPHIDDKGWIHL